MMGHRWRLVRRLLVRRLVLRGGVGGLVLVLRLLVLMRRQVLLHGRRRL
jgi:hypothetical protein